MAAILSTTFTQPATAQTAVWTLASVTGVQKGHVCSVESELAQVLQVGPGLTVKVLRGIEGTATAAHATSTPVAVYRANEVATGEPPTSPATVLLRQATVTLTNAQIKALPTTPVTILAAPGATRVYVPVLITLVTDTTGGGYSNVHTGSSTLAVGAPLNLRSFTRTVMNNANNTPDLTSLTDLLTSSWARVVVVDCDATMAGEASGTVGASGSVNYLDNFVNEPLAIWCDQSGGAFTGGHAANTLTASVLYSVLDVTTGLFV